MLYENTVRCCNEIGYSLAIYLDISAQCVKIRNSLAQCFKTGSNVLDSQCTSVARVQFCKKIDYRGFLKVCRYGFLPIFGTVRLFPKKWAFPRKLPVHLSLAGTRADNFSSLRVNIMPVDTFLATCFVKR